MNVEENKKTVKPRLTNFNLYFQDTYFVSESQGLHYVTTFGGILFKRLKAHNFLAMLSPRI